METVYDKKGLATEISISWSIEDVLWRAKDTKVRITRKEASEVLGLMKKKHDALIGINWEVIDIWIEYVINERKNNADTFK
jgi:hypothetical protein